MWEIWNWFLVSITPEILQMKSTNDSYKGISTYRCVVEFPTGTVEDEDTDPVADPPLLLPAIVPPAITTAAAASDGCDPSMDFGALESSAIFYIK